MIILLNKPYQVLCQFSPESGKETLANYVPVKNVYPAGRLDYDSEGLLILTDDGVLQHKISHPKFGKSKTYWAQVDGCPSHEALQQLETGILLKDGMTKPAKVTVINEPTNIWSRTPPIRYRANIPTTWLEIELKEGRNRQVRRMTAHIGHPTLRLIRCKIGKWELGKLQPGEYTVCEEYDKDD